MTTKHQVGQKVRVTIEGTITEVDGAEHIEIMYAFTDRLKGACGVLVEAVGVKIEALESGGEPVAEKPLRLGDVWQDRDGDTWRVVSNGELLLTSDGASDVRKAWGYVNNRWGPLTFVKHTEPAPVDAAPVLMLGDRWQDCDGDTWHVGRIEDGSIGLKYGGMNRTWASANANYGPLKPVGAES